MTEAPIIGVVGLGTMGLGIAQVYAAAGFSVLATDAHAPARDTALARLAESLAPRITAGKLTAEARDALLSQIRIVPGPAEMGGAALVIEAVIEDLAAKQALFATLETVVAPSAVLASNTSSLSIAAIFARSAHPSRGIGLHFFNPAPVMRLVELAAPSGTLTQSVSFARQVTEKAGKIVIECPGGPGFIVNRCARPYYGEALALLEHGRSAAEIDAAMQAAGYRLGPFALIDLIGADINLAATEGLHRAMGGHPRYHVFATLRQQVARGALGRKTGSGFVQPGPAAPPPFDADTIALRIEAALVNEACWLLSEGGTTEAGIDTALKLGLNFPRGPFQILHERGRIAILSTLAALEATAPFHLQGRYRPAPALATA